MNKWIAFHKQAACITRMQVYTAGIETFLLLWPWPWPDNLHIQTSPISSENVTADQKWTFYVKAFKRYCISYRCYTVVQVEAIKNITMPHHGWWKTIHFITQWIITANYSGISFNNSRINLHHFCTIAFFLSGRNTTSTQIYSRRNSNQRDFR